MTDYSYRTDPNVPAFADERPLLLFDGVCVLCTGFARFVLKADGGGRFRLASAQSPLGQVLYRHYGLDPVNFQTNLLIVDGRAYTKSEAFIEAMVQLGRPYSLARALRLCPTRVRDLLYDPIARNRYQWFGERQSCYVPMPEERSRFLS